MKHGSKKDKNKHTKTKAPSIDINADINDTNWKCIVVMAVESNVSNSDFISFFQEEAKKNIRPVIKSLTFENLIQSVKKSIGTKTRDKSKDSKSTKSSGKSSETNKLKYKRVSNKTDSGKSYVPLTEKADVIGSVLSGLKKGHVPPEMLAKLVKEYILNLKQSDIERLRTLELLQKEDNVNKIKANEDKSEDTKTDNIQVKKENENKKTKIKKESREKSLAKKEKKDSAKTEKRKSNKEKPVKKVLEINDQPRFGPNLYIVLSGFFDPNLIIEMVKVGIPLRGLVVVDTPTEDKTLKKEETVVPLSQGKFYKSKKSKKNCQSNKIEKLLNFWKDTDVVLNNPENRLQSKDVATIRITPSVHFKSSQQKKDKLSLAYNEMSWVMYIVHNYWMKYEMYINNITVVKVEDEHVLSLEDANLYCSLVRLIPMECCTTEVILHCLLEQVSWWGVEEGKKQSIESKQSLEEGIKHSLYNNVTPVLIDSYDFDKLTTFYLNIPALNFQDISSNMFFNSPVVLLWNKYPLSTNYSKKLYNYHLQNFQRCCQDIYCSSDYIFNIYLHQFLIERMMCANQDLITDFNLLPDDSFFIDDVNNILHDCGDIKPLVPEAVIVNSNIADKNENNSIEEVNNSYTEEKDNQINILLTLKEKQNLRDKDKAYLKSFLECPELRHLYDEISHFDNEEKYNAIKTEIKELKFVKEMDSKILTQTFFELYSKLKDISYNYFALTDSLIVCFNQNHDTNYINYEKSESNLNTLIGFKDFYNMKIILRDIETNNKTQILLNFKESNTHEGQGNLMSIESSKKLLNYEIISDNRTDQKLEYCYDLGFNYVTFKESVTDFYSPSGVHVELKKIKSWKESPLVGIKISSSNNVLSCYHAQPLMEKNEKIYFKTYNDIRISIDLKLIYNKNIPEENIHKQVEDVYQGKHKKKSQRKENVSSVGDVKPPAAENSDFGLQIVLPTGLFIEIVRTNSEIGPFYIRQKYLYKNPSCSKIRNEDYRCYLRNGSILVFKTDETVDILYSNGTIVKCTDFKYVVPEPEKGHTDLVLDSDTEKKQAVKGKKGNLKSKSTTKDKVKKKYSKSRKENNSDTSKKQKSKDKRKNFKSPKVKIKDVEQIDCIPSPVMKTNKFIISALGECLHVEDDVLSTHDQYYTLRTAYDPKNLQFYTFRSDATSSLYSNDTLVVSFPDGTRITTSCEEDINVNIPATTLDSIGANRAKEYVDRIYRKVYDNDNNKEDTGDDKNIIEDNWRTFATTLEEQQSQKEPIRNYMKAEDNIEGKNENVEDTEDEIETFDVLTMDCNLEHEYYATVYYNDRLKQTVIQLAGDVFVILHYDKDIEVKVGTETQLVIREDEVLLTSTSSQFPLLDSLTILTFPNSELKSESNQNQLVLDDIVCETIDSEGNVFLINKNGDAKSLIIIAELLGIPMRRSDLSEFVDVTSRRYFVVRRDMSGYEIVSKNHPIISTLQTTTGSSLLRNNALENNTFYNYYQQEGILETKSELYLLKQNKILPFQLTRKDLSKPKILKELWFPLVNKCGEAKPTKQLVKNFATPMYKAFRVENLQQVKDNIDIILYFNEALNKYVQKCYEKYNAYEQHEVKEVRTEEARQNSELLLNVFGSLTSTSDIFQKSVSESESMTISSEKLLQVTNLD